MHRLLLTATVLLAVGGRVLAQQGACARMSSQADFSICCAELHREVNEQFGGCCESDTPTEACLEEIESDEDFDGVCTLICCQRQFEEYEEACVSKEACDDAMERLEERGCCELNGPAKDRCLSRAARRVPLKVACRKDSTSKSRAPLHRQHLPISLPTQLLRNNRSPPKRQPPKSKPHQLQRKRQAPQLKRPPKNKPQHEHHGAGQTPPTTMTMTMTGANRAMQHPRASPTARHRHRWNDADVKHANAPRSARKADVARASVRRSARAAVRAIDSKRQAMLLQPLRAQLRSYRLMPPLDRRRAKTRARADPSFESMRNRKLKRG